MHEASSAIAFRLRALREALADDDRRLAEQASLKLVHMQALRAMLDHDEATPASVARALGLRPSTMTGVVDRLEREGLVQRVRHTGDRRKVTLRVTDAGEARLPASVRDRLADRIAALPSEHRHAIEHALDVLTHLAQSPHPHEA